MNWKVEFDEKAKNELLKLDKQTKIRVTKFIEGRLMKMDNPRAFGASLKGRLSGLWKYRVGDYRLICQIEDDIVTVLIIEIGHRREVYKK